MRLFGLIGKPLDHSPSPQLYNTVFKKLGLACRYLPFQVEPPYLKNLVLCMKLVDVEGLNITIPYKERVCALMGLLDRSAKQSGAVNTIVRRQNRFIGYNTDGLGFLMALAKRKRFDPKEKTIVVVGSGGAARGIAAALGGAGAKKIFILNRHLSRAKRVAAFLRKNFPKTRWEARPLAFRNNPDLVVQTTPVSLKTQGPVIDIRLHTDEGCWMLAYQAHLNLKLWIHRSIDPAWLRQIALRALKRVKLY